MADLPVEDTTNLPRGKPAFNQDPHRVRDITERNLEAAIGREVRNFRRQQGMTVADLAGVTGLSIGMLSKIENGNTSPSLTTLQVLSHAFSVPVTAFFKSHEENYFAFQSLLISTSILTTCHRGYELRHRPTWIGTR